MGTKRIILQNAPSRKGENNCRVFERHPDGRISNLGFVTLKYFRHLRMSAWEATGTDGHRAVHEHHWQAVWALTWDETGSPFPVTSNRVWGWTIDAPAVACELIRSPII
jgi:hypothetical protein